MKKLSFLLLLSLIIISYSWGAEIKASSIDSHWKGKTVAFLGDSITDVRHVGTTKNYWEYLSEMLGIKRKVYGINGDTFNGSINQAKKMKAELGQAVDAIFIFLGTNDYNSSVPLGEWYEIKEVTKPLPNGKTMQAPRRFVNMNGGTLKGRINILMSYLKANFPDQQIIMLTPIHRGFATFGAGNVQPDEGFANKIGLYIDDYVKVIKEVANVWAIPVIDLNSECGLYPLAKSNEKFFANAKKDMLHPNALGHYKIANSLAYRLLCYPSNFKTRVFHP